MKQVEERLDIKNIQEREKWKVSYERKCVQKMKRSGMEILLWNANG